MARWLNCAAVLALALTALLFGSGCHIDFFAYAVGYNPDYVSRFIVKCNSDTMTLQLYEYNEEDEFAIFIGSFFSHVTPVGSPINGKPCSKSTDLQNRPFSESDAVDAGLIIPLAVNGSPHADAAPGSSSSTGNAYPSLVPLMFTPFFPTTDASRVTRSCPPSLHAYLVNHTEGTVTSFQVCPLQRKTDISVQSNPLQLALTPDGSTVLVTSYDSAITFIDTATDKVTFTLPTPGYNPQGIAISPDGTRAYVTHYLDASPSLLVIDIPNRKLLSTIPLAAAYPRVVVITPDGSQAWVNYWNNSYISVVDLLTQTVAETLNFGAPISEGMAFNPQGTKAFVLADPGVVLVIDTATLTQVAQIQVGPYPSDIKFTSNGLVYTNSATQEGLWVVDPVKNKLLSGPAPGTTGGGSMGLLVY